MYQRQVLAGHVNMALIAASVVMNLRHLFQIMNAILSPLAVTAFQLLRNARSNEIQVDMLSALICELKREHDV